MFNKVVWQNMQGVVGYFNNDFTANLPKILTLKKYFENQLRFGRIMAKTLWPHFLAYPVYALKFHPLKST